MRPTLPRRELVLCTTAIFAALQKPPAWAIPMRELTSEDKEALDLASRSAKGLVLPSGVRVIDVNKGSPDARLPASGERVYCHFKVWTKGFRSGVPVDSSFTNTRPYDWFLGQPDERMRPGFDEGARGMREGDWRRLVVPASLAYGEAGLQKNARGAMLVPPNKDVFVDLLMMEEAKCDPLLRPVVPKVGRVGFAHEGNQRSLLCRPGVP